MRRANLRQRRLPETLGEHERKVDPSCQMPNDELLSFGKPSISRCPKATDMFTACATSKPRC